jgi:predicted Zn finger-like uncharacterized protein
MTSFKAECEYCDAVFKISDPSRIGKRVKCPKCGEAFTIKAPPPPPRDDEDDDEPLSRPLRSSASRSKNDAARDRKKPAKETASPVLLYSGGGAVALVVIAVIVWMATSSGETQPAAVASPPPVVAAPKPSASAFPLADVLNRLPADTEIVLHVRVKDVVNSPLAASARTPAFDEQWRGMNPLIPGTTFSGINTVTVSISNVTLQMSEAVRLQAHGVEYPKDAMPTPIVIVGLNDPITPEFMNLPADSGIKVGNRTIYKRDGNLFGAPPCLTIAEPKVVVLGTEAQLRAWLGQGTSTGIADDFPLIDGQAHVSLAIHPRGILQQMERLAVINVPSPGLHIELNRLAQKGAKSFGVLLTANAALEGALVTVAADSARQADLEAAMTARLQSAVAELSAPPSSGQPIVAALRTVLEGAKIRSEGERVMASFSVAPETLHRLWGSALAMLPAVLPSVTPPATPGAN